MLLRPDFIVLGVHYGTTFGPAEVFESFRTLRHERQIYGVQYLKLQRML